MSIILTALQKQRRDTAANWTSVNPTLLAGEIGIESDTNKWKVGTGSAAWTSLGYAIGGTYPLVNADISATAEIAVSKLADGTARQLLQTDAAGTGVEWASNIDVPGTLDVTSAATFDSTVAVTGALTKSGSNVVTVGDTGTVTSTMILDGTIVNADINASAAIVDTKLATIATAGKVSNSATTATNANTASAIVARDASNNFTAGTITAALTGAASSNVLKAGDTMTGALVHPLGAVGTPSITFTGDLDTGVFSPGADQLVVATNGVARLTTSTTAVSSSLAIDHPLGAVGTPSITFTGDLNTGVYSPGADQVAISTGGTGRLFVDATGNVGIGGPPGQALQLTRSAASAFIQITDGTINSYFGVSNAASAVVIDVASNTPFRISTNNLERLRIDSSGRLLVGTGSDSGGALFQVNGDRIRVGTAKTPATSGATGTTGEIAWDANYIYVCTATNTWKRSAIATW